MIDEGNLDFEEVYSGDEDLDNNFVNGKSCGCCEYGGVSGGVSDACGNDEVK